MAKCFKVGDRVFATRNSTWGLKPMRVIKVHSTGASCKHPAFTSGGWFGNSELMLVTKARQKKLENVEELVAEARVKGEALFGTWHGC